MPTDNNWYRNRGYIHFDAPVNLKKAIKIVTSPETVSTHAFYPLINYTINSFKVFKNEHGKIEKKKKPRPIAYASHIDSHIYAYYAQLLAEKYEHALKVKGLDENIIAFRSLGKSNINFANDAFEEIIRRRSCSAIAIDITGFFDNLDHQLLKQQWSNVLGVEKLSTDHFNVFRSVTRYSKVSRDALYTRLKISKNNPKYDRMRVCTADVFRNVVRAEKLIQVHQDTKGIPQGSPISALLSNLYMLSFDVAAKQISEKYEGTYYRYCDDMLFIVPTAYKDLIQQEIAQEIVKVKLEINPDKTEVRDFWPSGAHLKANKPLQYLGFIFDGTHKLLRSAALAKFSSRMKAGVRLAKKTRNKANQQEREAGSKETPLFKRKLYERYSHLSKRNFITYGYRASGIMNSNAIRKQLKPLWGRLRAEFEDDNS